MGIGFENQKNKKRTTFSEPDDDQQQLTSPPIKSSERIKDDSDTYDSEKIKDMIATYHPDEIGVVFLNVGQGDATIIRFPDGKVMVVDCNVDNSPEDIVEYLKVAGIERIDYLVITHQHHDHTSGLKDIADNFEVGEVWTTQYRRKKSEESEETYQTHKEEYLAGINTLKRKGADIKTPTAKNEPIIEDGKIKVKVLGPSSYVQGNNEDIHEESMAIQIKFGSKSIFLPGDTTTKGIDRINSNYDLKNTTIWHAPHHGSDEGLHEDALREAKPKFTIVSVGKDNPHGHPHDEAMNRYRKFTQRKVYRTDKGNIGIRLNSKGDDLDIQE